MQKTTATPSMDDRQKSTNRMMLWFIPILLAWFTLSFQRKGVVDSREKIRLLFEGLLTMFFSTDYGIERQKSSTQKIFF